MFVVSRGCDIEQITSGCSLLGLLSLFLLSGLAGSLSLLDDLGDELLVLHGLLRALLGLSGSSVLADGLAADSLLGHETLDLWGLPEGLVTSLDGSVSNVLADIILGLVEVEEGSNLASSLLLESVWSVDVGDTSDVLLSLLDNREGNDSEVWSADASSDRLSLSLTSSSWSVGSSACT